MRVHRARPGSGLLIPFSILLCTCGTAPTAELPSANAGIAEAAAETTSAANIPQGETTDRTLAPYFLVQGSDGAVDPLPLKNTQAEVYIAGAMAEVHVSQFYKNQGTKPVEAVYLFPASTRAAVRAMKMTVGARVIEAQIRERDAARRVFRIASAQGRTASLLEQQRPNLFQMNVANILPGDEVRVDLCYVELIVPEKHVYEFVYPTTVGPRYTKKSPAEEPEGSALHSASTQSAGAAAPTFALRATLNSGIPFQKIELPSHPMTQLTREQPTTARLTLPPSAAAGNRDFVLRYSLEGNQIESGLLLDPAQPARPGEAGTPENHFLLMMEPPQRIEPSAIVPREYIFVVDVSGSMYGFPLDTGKQLMRHLVAGLRPKDSFNILSFAGGDALLAASSLAATPENLRAAGRYLDTWVSGGGTELLPALKRALLLPRKDGTSRTIVVITDGYVDVEKETFDLIRSSLGSANLFAFGIGSSVNRFLIEGMARAGQGAPFVVLSAEEAAAKAAAFQSYISSPVLQGVHARFAGLDVYDVEPPALPDLFAERPLLIHGKYRGEAVGQLVVQGHTATADYEQTIAVAGAARSPQRGMLGVLWARARIARLADLEGARDSSHKEEIKALGLQHHLMTAYTSFVAVDSAVRAADRGGATVQQPSVPPDGVSSATGSGAIYGMARRAGVLGVTGTPALANMAGTSSALGRDAADVMGGLIGTEVGDAYGEGGLGLVGSGRGGGGYGTLGLGALPNRGLPGSRYAQSEGSAPRSQVIPGPLTIRGSLHQDLILRVLRRHVNELRFCYERELVRDGALKGQVTIQFTVGANGRVLASIVLASNLGSPPVEQCLAAATRRWEFPSPQAGIVVITAPIKLLPAPAKRPARTSGTN